MSIVLSRDYGVEVCEILGLNPEQVSRINIEFTAYSTLTATIDMPLTSDKAEKTIKLIRGAKGEP